LGVGRFLSAKLYGGSVRERTFAIKKLPPPTPDGREGRLFPPEQSSKTSRLLNELRADGNKFIQKNFDPFPPLSQRGKHKQINHRKKINK
jgi:hypothetical protein